MKAMVLPAPGDDTMFVLTELPDPVSRPGHLIVRVRAAGVNLVDCKLKRRGGPVPQPPIVLGADFAGEVIAVADDVSDFEVGDRVFACGGGIAGSAGGALAEQILVDARLVAPMPASLPFREAAALPLAGITAWEGLRRAEAGPGKSVLVIGGAGGVGHLAVQIACAWGATVTATVSAPDRAAVARRLGATHVVLRSMAEDLPAAFEAIHGGTGFDIVFDASGAGDLAMAIRQLRIGGQLVMISGAGTAVLGDAFRKAASVHFVYVLIPMLHGAGRSDHGAMLRNMTQLVETGRLVPLLDRHRFGLVDADEAFRRVESGGSLGKVVIDIE